MLFYHLAVVALLGKLLLIAGHAVVVGILLYEAPGANGLLATVAGETILVPTVALMLHLFRAWWVEEADRKRKLKNLNYENKEYRNIEIKKMHCSYLTQSLLK